jgi:DNA-3-methyladenine glycosylase
LKILPRTFYERDPREVAPDLLNKILVGRQASGRIVEVEAYVGSLDPGSHAYRGATKRNKTMFGRGGHLYVYFTYGMHWCANAVCGPEGEAGAVLLRALAPLDGLDEMRRRRGGRVDRELCAGPARLCQALAIAGPDDGADLVTGDRGLHLVDDGTAPPREPGCSRRIGLSRGVELPWRWYVPGEPNLSRREAAGSHSRRSRARRSGG